MKYITYKVINKTINQALSPRVYTKIGFNVLSAYMFNLCLKSTDNGVIHHWYQRHRGERFVSKILASRDIAKIGIKSKWNKLIPFLNFVVTMRLNKTVLKHSSL